MKTLREIRAEECEKYVVAKERINTTQRVDYFYGFDSGFKAAIEMLRSEEAELYQNEERLLYKKRVSPSEWADYLEKMENSNG